MTVHRDRQHECGNRLSRMRTSADKAAGRVSPSHEYVHNMVVFSWRISQLKLRAKPVFSPAIPPPFPLLSFPFPCLSLFTPELHFYYPLSLPFTGSPPFFSFRPSPLSPARVCVWVWRALKLPSGFRGGAPTATANVFVTILTPENTSDNNSFIVILRVYYQVL